jgi:hypothetical protein
MDMVRVLGQDFETLSYWMDLCEFHCTNKKFRRFSPVADSADEKILHSSEYQEPEWHSISPESMLLNVLYNILCK